ncbi:MAG: carboxypeptidase regulatory-like domain-containing protein [Thermoplasmata archaeon]
MKPKTAGKLATGLIVLLMVLSGAMVLQWNVRAEERHVGTVEGIIQAEDGSLIPEGFDVDLENINEEEVISSQTQKGGYFQFPDIDVGHYKITVPSQTHHRAYLGSETEIFYLGKNVTEFQEIEVVSHALIYTLNGTVFDEQGNVVEDAQIHIFDGDYHFQTGIEDPDNGTFEFDVYKGTFNLRVSAEDYAPYIRHDMVVNETTTVNGTMTMDVVLKNTPQVTGYLWSTGSEGQYGVTSEMEVTLINHANDDMLRETMAEGNPWFNIGATTGEYTLIVSADGYKQYINENIVIPDNNTNEALGRVFVDESQPESINTTLDFHDWNTLTVTRERTFEINSRMTGLDYWYLGNLRMQIDRVFGDGDGVVTQAEVNAFRGWLEYREAKHTTSQRMLWMEDTVYTLDDFDFHADELNSLIGGVTVDMDTITVTSVRHYSPEEEIEMDEDESLLLFLGLKNDIFMGNYRDYSYELNLPDGFERVPTDLEDIPDDVEAEGFTEIIIHTPEGVGRSYLTLDIHQSEKGEASLALVEDINVYLMEDESYAVQLDTNVTCIAELTDPVNDPKYANYTWLVDNSEIGKYGSEIIHSFDREGEVNLTARVRQAGGSVVSAYANIIVDGTGPQGEIEIEKSTVDEGEEITFSTYNFTDETETREFTWNFSDGSEHVTGTNVSHSFDLYGTYQVSVNATDVVGNWNIEYIEIVVEDVTSPVASFVAHYDDEEMDSENITATMPIERRKEFSLDATPSYDPAGFDGEKGDISVVWWMSGMDYRTEDFEILGYSIDEIGTYDVYLNVTDEAGNYNNISRTIEVVPGPAPNIEVTEVFLSEEDIEDGKTVQVIANVTNYGQANATNVNVVFRVDGKIVAVTPKFYHIDGEEAPSTIPVDEYRHIKFDWTGEEGEKTLEVNITDVDEPADWFYDNVGEITVDVSPPQWRTLIGYILVPVIIIGVAVGLYLNKEKVQNLLRK